MNIFNLPNEMIAQVLSYLNLSDLAQTAQVSTFFWNHAQRQLAEKKKIASHTLFPIIEKYGCHKTVAKLPGHLLAIAGWDGILTIWDYSQGKAIKKWHTPTVWVNNYSDRDILSLTYLGNDLIFFINYTRTAHVFNYKTEDCFSYQLPIRPNSLLKLTAHEILIGSPRGSIEILNLDSGKLRFVFTGQGNAILSLSKCSNTQFLSACRDGSIGIWRIDSPSPVKILDPKINYNWANQAIKLNETEIAGAYDDGIRIWNYESGQCIQHLTVSFDYSQHREKLVAENARLLRAQLCCKNLLAIPEDRLIASYGDGTVRIWDCKSGQCLKTITGKDNPEKLIRFGIT